MAQIIYSFNAEEAQRFSEGLRQAGIILSDAVMKKELSERVLEEYTNMSQEILKNEHLTLDTSEFTNEEDLGKAYGKLAELMGFFCGYRAKQ